MQKKGQLISKYLMELLVVAIVIITFIAVSYSYGSGEAISKVRIARDIGLIIEEMYALPNNINTFVIYPEDTSKFNIVIKDNTAKVISDVGDITEASYSFVTSQNHMPLDITIKKPKELYIGKINGNIVITDKKPDLRKLSCGQIKNKLEINKILIDSGIDENANLEKAKIANSIAFSLISKFSKNYEVKHARNDDINTLLNNPLSSIKSKLEQKIEEADTIIKIQIGEKDDTNNNIKIYFSPTSEKQAEISTLGCNILNNLIEHESLSDITGIAVIQKDTEFILKNNKISMIIEIGNYLNQKSLDMLKNIEAIEIISSTVYNTIENEVQ